MSIMLQKTAHLLHILLLFVFGLLTQDRSIKNTKCLSSKGDILKELYKYYTQNANLLIFFF